MTRATKWILGAAMAVAFAASASCGSATPPPRGEFNCCRGSMSYSCSTGSQAEFCEAGCVRDSANDSNCSAAQ